MLTHWSYVFLALSHRYARDNTWDNTCVVWCTMQSCPGGDKPDWHATNWGCVAWSAESLPLRARPCFCRKILSLLVSLKWKCCHFDQVFATDCTGSCTSSAVSGKNFTKMTLLFKCASFVTWGGKYCLEVVIFLNLWIERQCYLSKVNSLRPSDVYTRQ